MWCCKPLCQNNIPGPVVLFLLTGLVHWQALYAFNFLRGLSCIISMWEVTNVMRYAGVEQQKQNT